MGSQVPRFQPRHRRPHLGFPESTAGRLAIETWRAYREQMADCSSMRAFDVWYDRIDESHFMKEAKALAVKRKVRKVMDDNLSEARRKSVPEFTFPKLVRLEGAVPRIKDQPPLLFHPDEKLAPGAQSGFREALDGYRASLAEPLRVLFDRFSFCYLAVKVVGVGSVGTRCSLRLFMAAENDPLFLQVKEARASVPEPYAGKSLHRNHGERVVVGQRLKQASSDLMLGWAVSMGGHDVYCAT
jgi:uncharacterized protein (DUF2252 family)